MDYAIKKDNMYESITFYCEVIQTEGKAAISLCGRVLGADSFVVLKTISGANSITDTSVYSDYIELKLTSKKPFDYTLAGINARYRDKRKIEDFLYEISYGKTDYDYAYAHFDPVISGGCSSVRNGSFFGRNFDWLYNNQVQFVVHTPKSLHTHEVLGVSGIIPGVEKSNVDDTNIMIDGVDMFKLVPFYLLDGINECGVFCTHNVVPLDDEDEPTMEIVAPDELYRVPIPMLPRFILDRFGTADEALEFIREHVTLYFTDTMISAGYQSHFMLGDALNTYIIEFFNNEMKTIKSNYITNFNIIGVNFDENNFILYPPSHSGINKYGSGLERWNIISSKYVASNTKEGMDNLMDSINYSLCYSEPFWYSEIVKMDDDEGNKITVDTPSELCTDAKETVIEKYNNRSRNNPEVWITCHSSIYDLTNKLLYIRNQENEKQFIFKL